MRTWCAQLGKLFLNSGSGWDWMIWKIKGQAALLKFNMKRWNNPLTTTVQREIPLRHNRRFHVMLWEHTPCHIVGLLDFTIWWALWESLKALDFSKCSIGMPYIGIYVWSTRHPGTVECGTLKIRIPETDSKNPWKSAIPKRTLIYSKHPVSGAFAAVSFRQGCSNSLQCLPRFVATNVYINVKVLVGIPYKKCNNPGGDWHPGWVGG